MPISSNDYVFWRDDGIYRGDENIPIGAQRVDDFLLDSSQGDVDINALDTVQGVADPFNKTVLWRYRSRDGSDRLIGWDWELDRFFRDRHRKPGCCSRRRPRASRWRRMDAVRPHRGFASTIRAILRRTVWKGGAPTVGAFTSARTRSPISPAHAMAGTIETATLELTPDARSFVSGARLKGNCGTGSTVQAGIATLPDEAPAFGAAAAARRARDMFPLRADGFFHRFRVNTSAGDTGFTHLHGISVDVQPSGEA